MNGNYILGIVALAGLVLISSCSKDDPPPNAGINFEVAEIDVNESDGTVQSFPSIWKPVFPSAGNGTDVAVKLVLDRPLTEFATISYTLGGTANLPGQSTDSDFEIRSGLNTIVSSLDNRIVIEKGAKEATIIFRVYDNYDLNIDDDDNLFTTGVITLNSVVSGPAVLGEQKTFTLKIHENSALVLLFWDGGTGEGSVPAKDIDMDMFFWRNNNGSWSIWDASIIRPNQYPPAFQNDPYEILLIPASLPSDDEYALSYTYYNGEANEVNLDVLIWGNVNNQFYPYFFFNSGQFAYFTAQYTLDNLNHYTISNNTINPEPLRVQPITKNNLNFNVSAITRPEAGSRVALGSELPKSFKDLKQKLIQIRPKSLQPIKHFDE
jgi:hypothetical protein